MPERERVTKKRRRIADIDAAARAAAQQVGDRSPRPFALIFVSPPIAEAPVYTVSFEDRRPEAPTRIVSIDVVSERFRDRDDVYEFLIGGLRHHLRGAV